MKTQLYNNQNSSLELTPHCLPVVNVMEEFVMQEAANQLNALPHEVARQIDLADVVALTLNQECIKPMYITTVKGYNQQKLVYHSNYEFIVRRRVRDSINTVKKNLSLNVCPKVILAQSSSLLSL